MSFFLSFSTYLLCLFPIIALSESYYLEKQQTNTSANSSDYTCKVDDPQCLYYLHNVLLNKQSNRGIYQYCKITYKNAKSCCIDPSQCQESWGIDLAQDLRNDSLEMVQDVGENLLSCKLNELSDLVNSLSSTQRDACEFGTENCVIECENKLKKFKQDFKRCFSIPDSLSIEKVLSKAKIPSKNHNCYEEMKKVVKKYKEQSLNKKSLLREKLKAKDIVNCTGIKDQYTKSNLDSFALSICHQAQEQNLQEEEKEKRQKKTKRVQSEENINSIDFSKNKSKEKKRASKKSLEEPKEVNSTSKNTSVKKVQNLSLKKNKAKQKPLTQRKSKLKKPSSTAKFKNTIEGPRENLSDNRLTRSGLITSNHLALAPLKVSSGNCPVSMPHIKSAVVFQSVEAPQIEPMNKQEFQIDPNNPDFKSYDLVMRKPAGVLIKLKAAEMDRNKEFAMDIRISSDNKYGRRCFHEPMKEVMRERQTDFCFFNQSDLSKEGIFKFFPLPMEKHSLNKEGRYFIDLTLYPRGYANNKKCRTEKEIEINIIKTHDLKLGLTRIYGENHCRKPNNIKIGYNVVSYDQVKRFSTSNELVRYIPSMFPLLKVDSRVLRYKLGGKILNYVHGRCNNNLVKDESNSISEDKLKITAGLLSDIARLEETRVALMYHKLMAIVPNKLSYFS